MIAQNNPNDRLMKFLQATPDVQAKIDQILEGKGSTTENTLSGPLLYSMKETVSLLNVSRATLWRLIKAGRLQKVEILPGSYRIRRSDLEAFVNGKTDSH